MITKTSQPLTGSRQQLNGHRNKFNVPVFPHLKKFIHQLYGSGPILAEEYSLIGQFVTLALRDHRTDTEYNDQYRDRLSEAVTIVLTKDQLEMAPRINKLIRINKYLDRQFKDQLITWIKAQRAIGMPAHPACRDFLTHYKIEEREYSLDAAYKYWQRWCK